MLTISLPATGFTLDAKYMYFSKLQRQMCKMAFRIPEDLHPKISRYLSGLQSLWMTLKGLCHLFLTGLAKTFWTTSNTLSLFPSPLTAITATVPELSSFLATSQGELGEC